MQKRRIDTIFAGLSLFAMFLGAGNIIFPPYMGAQSGDMWWLSSLGFVVTGTSLPLLGVLAVANVGGTADAISARVSHRFAHVFNTLILIFIGPLFAIPRTAATTIEMSILPYMPQANPKWVLLVGSALFFIICLAFALSENSVIDTIGRYLTPILAGFMLFLIITAVFRPPGTPVPPAVGLDNFFYNGFKTGYQTMDGMGSIVLGGTVALSLMQKGYQGAELKRSLRTVALIAGLGLGIVYIGFAYIGAAGSGVLQNIHQYPVLTVKAVQILAGQTGQVVLSLVIFFACLTTATGLIATLGTYFRELLKHRFSYRQVAIVVTLISFAISTLGVDSIVGLAEPILEVMYPVVIVLIILNLFGHRIHSNMAFKGAVYATIAISIIMFLSFVPLTSLFAKRVLFEIPLGEEGFPYLIPAAVGLIIGWFIEMFWARRRKERDV